MPTTTHITAAQQQFGAAEWAARVDLAAFYRLVASYGWDDLLLAHLSARIPGEDAYLINPYGLLFEEITASSLLKVDYTGRKLLDSDYDISPEANVIHGAVLTARPDVHCVAHVHTVAGTAVASQKQGLQVISQQAMMVARSLAYHDYEGVVFDPAEGPGLVADLGDKRHMILRNHGLLTVGASVSQAFQALYNLQRSCEMQAAGDGHECTTIEPAAMARSAQLFAGMQGAAPRDLLWEALLRRLRRREPEFES